MQSEDIKVDIGSFAELLTYRQHSRDQEVINVVRSHVSGKLAVQKVDLTLSARLVEKYCELYLLVRHHIPPPENMEDPYKARRNVEEKTTAVKFGSLSDIIEIFDKASSSESEIFKRLFADRVKEILNFQGDRIETSNADILCSTLQLKIMEKHLQKVPVEQNGNDAGDQGSNSLGKNGAEGAPQSTKRSSEKSNSSLNEQSGSGGSSTKRSCGAPPVNDTNIEAYCESVVLKEPRLLQHQCPDKINDLEEVGGAEELGEPDEAGRQIDTINDVEITDELGEIGQSGDAGQLGESDEIDNGGLGETDELERIAPQKPEKVKRKYTRRVPKDDSKPVARGRKRKADSDLTSTVVTPRKRTLVRELSGSPSIQDMENIEDEPSTSSFSAGSLNYRVSVDVNMETSASEQNSPNIASDDGEPKKKNRKQRDSQLTMTHRRRKNAKKEGKALSKTALIKLERKKRMMEKSQVAMEIQKSKFRAASLQFKFEADLEYALSASSNRFPMESIERIKKHLFEKKVSRKNPHYLRTEISFDAVFPDQDDYRHCTAYRQEATIGCTMPLSTRRSGGKTPPSAPPLILFGTLYTDLNTTAHDVQEHAMNWFKMHRNDIFKKSDKFEGPEPDENLAELERRFYKEVYGDTSLDEFTGVERNRIQTPVIKVETQADLENKNLERILNTASITVVSGICRAAGIDMSLFELNVLTEIDEKLMIDCLYQTPQSADNNFDKEGEKTWRTSGVRIQKKLQWFADYMQGRYNQADKYLEKMANSSNLNETEEKILKEIVKEQEEFPEDADVSMYWSIFGTNIDLQDRAMFPEQHVHIDKLPVFLRPRFEGNLLNLIGEDVLGINTVQVYVKAPGARTAAHMENALMASININLGPGTCVWFAVPYEYWGKLEEIIKSEGLKYHDQDYWPDEDELRANGIPVQKFEQKQDELVYVNTGCFHWVQSSGYCINVSWNVGQPTATQLSTSMIATTHNVLSRYQDHVPVMGIAWRIAREKLFMHDEEMYKVVRSILIRTLAHTTWYEDELRVHGKKIIPREQLEFPIPAVVRCIQCGAEVFNVVKWFLGNKHIPSTVFCNRCHPKLEHTRDRKEAYTVLTPRAELMEIMDAYTKRSLEDTSSTSKPQRL